MFVHTLPGSASFGAGLRLFRSYPLAVNPRCPGDAAPAGSAACGRDGKGLAPPRCSGGGCRSIVLRHLGFDGSGYYVLTQDPADHFTLRPWDAGDGDGDGDGHGECQQIRPGTPVPVTSHQIITEGLPVPRDGALLGWVSDRQATALLSVYHGRPGRRGGVPQIRVLAVAGSEPSRWPPFAASPLDDGRLWEYVERGEITDLAPLMTRNAGDASWVPSQNPARAAQGHGCVVVGRSLQAGDYWVPAGIYMDHWMLREGVPAPPAGHLLTLPGTTDLSRHLTAH